jgi:hypothetical protein
MAARLTALVALVAGCAAASAQAQQSVTFQWSFTEVVAGTTTPVATPNGLIEPGEGAELRLNVSYAPVAGTSIVTVLGPATVLGLNSIFFDLMGDGGAAGNWQHLGRATGWEGLTAAGAPSLDRTSMLSGSAQQLVFAPMPVNSANPVVNIWRVVWTPDDYTVRQVTFTGQRAGASGPSGTGADLWANWNGTYISHPVAGPNFGSLNIPVVPAPSSLALLGIAGAMVARRRR